MARVMDFDEGVQVLSFCYAWSVGFKDEILFKGSCIGSMTGGFRFRAYT
jgi:hypothetical protein